MTCSNTVDWKEAVLNSFKRFVTCPSCIKKEDNEEILTKNLLNQLGWTGTNYQLRSMFGQDYFKTDKKITHINGNCLNSHFILEVKKAIPNTEWAYWHGVIQTLLYRYSLTHDPNSIEPRDLPILCVVVDWGRVSYRFLCYCEIDFLCKYFKDKNIFFLRIAFDSTLIRLEHNLSSDGNWCRCRYNKYTCKWDYNYISPCP
jgi:hypothetical protein